MIIRNLSKNIFIITAVFLGLNYQSSYSMQQQPEPDLLSWFKNIFQILPESSEPRREILASIKLQLVRIAKGLEKISNEESGNKAMILKNLNDVLKHLLSFTTERGVGDDYSECVSCPIDSRHQPEARVMLCGIPEDFDDEYCGFWIYLNSQPQACIDHYPRNGCGLHGLIREIEARWAVDKGSFDVESEFKKYFVTK
jgi:hypothetical protein